MKKILTAVILAWVMVFIWYTDIFYFIEDPLTDRLKHQNNSINPRIKIITVDSTSLEKLGLLYWSRENMAELVDKVASVGATAIWINENYTSKSASPVEDEALADVIRKHKNVYLPVEVNFDVVGQPTRIMEKEYLKVPIFDLSFENIAHTRIMTDKDGVVRKILPGVPTLDNEIIPIIGVRFANLLLPEHSQIDWDKRYNWTKGQEEINLDKQLQIGFFYSSTDKAEYDTISAWSIMTGETDPAYFKDSLVLIGVYEDDAQNLYKTSTIEKMPEVEIHANMIQALVEDRLYTEASDSLAVTIVVLTVMLGFYLFDALKPKIGGLLLAVLTIVYSGVVIYLLNYKGLLLPYFSTLISLDLAYFTSFAYNKLIKS